MVTIDTVDGCLQTVEASSPYDAIPFHTGINDIKTREADDASQRLVACVESILQTMKTTRAILSMAAPTTRADLAAKRELFNTLCLSALHESDRVTFVTHDNTQLGSDDLHPTPPPRGANILASNTGQDVVGFFSQQQRRCGHHRPRHQQVNRPTDSKRKGPTRRTGRPHQQQPPRTIANSLPGKLPHDLSEGFMS